MLERLRTLAPEEANPALAPVRGAGSRILVLAALTALVVVAMGITTTKALAQGPFLPAQTWWIGPGGTTGVATDAGGQNLLIDTDGDGMIEAGEGVHPIPSILFNQLVSANYRLSPSRQYLYVFGSPSGTGCTGTLVYFYRIPTTSGEPLQARVLGQCIDGGIAMQGFYDYTPMPDIAMAFVVSNSNGGTTGTQEIFWVELSTGLSAFTNNLDFHSAVASVSFEPSGIAAFVQHDTSDGDNLADYTVVELCPDDFGLGMPQGGGNLDQLPPPVATAESVDDGMGGLDVRISQGTTIVDQFPLDTCGTTPPPTGACCLPDGSCADGLSQATCEGAALGGTWQGSGTSCSGSSCPVNIVLMSLHASGPSSVPVNTNFTYTLQYGNLGTLPATNVLIRATVPNGLDFVSVGGGGSYNASLRQVSWTLGTVNGGTSGPLQFTVRAPCGTPIALLSAYSLYSDQVFVAGTPWVWTTFTNPASDPLTVGVSSTAENGEPVLNGDTITHTITLTNHLAQVRPSVNFSLFYGSSQEPDQVLDDGGGAATLGPSTFSWMGDLGPNATVSVIFRTKLSDCRIAGVTETQLNNGAAISIQNSCGTEIGPGTPPAALTLGDVPVAVTLATTNLNLSQVPPGSYWAPIALVRAGGDVDFEMTITNNYGEVWPGVTVSQAIPPELTPDGDPPFLGSPPAGTSYDAPSQTITWSGDLQPNQTLVIRWRAQFDGTTGCRVLASASFHYGSCGSVYSSAPAIYAVPLPPPGPYLLGVTLIEGLYTYEFGVDTQLSEYTCVSFEIHTGLGLGVGDDLWVAGTPVYRLNPVTLEMDVLDTEYFNTLGMRAPADVVVADDGTVYFAGSNLNDGARILAYDPSTQGTTVIYDAPSSTLYGLQRIVLDDDGFLAATTYSGILRLDPANPGGAQIYSDSGVISTYLTIVVDTDGNYLVCDHTYGTGVARKLVKVDRTTGVHTVEVADLNAMAPSDNPFLGMAVAADGSLYLAPQYEAFVWRLDRSVSPPTAASIGGTYTQHADLAVVGEGPTSVGDPTVVQPKSLQLSPAAPNPFNPSTTIRFGLPADGHARLVIHDLRGRHVRTLVDAALPGGFHEVVWNGRDDDGASVASGVYFVRLQVGPHTRTTKVVLAK